LVIFPNSDCVENMNLILAVDLMGGLVVHGRKGERSTYAPLTWGAASSARPINYLLELSPRFAYIADLDRIEGTGSHDSVIEECAGMVECCYVDRGCRSPSDFLDLENVMNIVGTETGGEDLSLYPGGILSVDIKDGTVIPSNENPLMFLKKASKWNFEGCIILNLGSVGTEAGLDEMWLEDIRSAYPGSLLYGGGVGSPEDLYILNDSGFDGAIIATAVHNNRIPLEWVRRGTLC
jgi:phosphoribosylformimino-5-aminoimidazole carboxamide ribotide isomerase